MNGNISSLRFVLPALFAGAVLLAGHAAGQDRHPIEVPQGGPPPAGLNREGTWPAPTAEDWKKPCLIAWQRSWEDALSVAQETDRPILICVNMDGEIASEHYAGIRYRQPEIARLYEPYVCVIASVYRHNPRDYDEQGRRILCPRFGSVTCGEHIAIEPILYEKFFDGRRIAPRHIMVELDGSETYDVFYTWDTESVFTAVTQGIATRTISPKVIVRGDRPIVERVASRDLRDRQAVETAYQQGDAELRRDLLEAASRHDEAAPVDLLRLGAFGLNVDLGKLARGALARTNQVAATDVIADTLQVPMERAERDALIDALGRLGKFSPRAHTLAVVHKGLVTRSRTVDVEQWSKSLGGAEYPAPAVESYEAQSRLDDQDRALASQDPAERIKLAEAFLERALDPQTDEKFARLYFLDARRTALEAKSLGAADWRADGIAALGAYYLKDFDEATRLAEEAAATIPSGETSWNSMAVLELFAKMRMRAILSAAREKKDWPGEWLTDVNAVCSVLARHPYGTDAQVAWHFDLLDWLGARGQAFRVLDEGLERFPDSWALHARLRGRVLRAEGVEGLEVRYDEMLGKRADDADLEWYAGYAAVVAAEYYRRRGGDEKAQAAYTRAIAHYERAIELKPAGRESADRQVALALAGQARLAFERGEDREALDHILASFERRPGAAATLDGLNISPVDTARMLLERLRQAQQGDLVAALEAGLGKLDPELLRLPAYERETPRRRGRRGQRGPRQGRGGGG